MLQTQINLICENILKCLLFLQLYIITFRFVNVEERIIKNEQCYQRQRLEFLLQIKFNIIVCETNYSVL